MRRTEKKKEAEEKKKEIEQYEQEKNKARGSHCVTAKVCRVFVAALNVCKACFAHFRNCKLPNKDTKNV